MSSALFHLFSYPPSVGNYLPVIPIYFDNLFSCLSEENYSVHTCLQTFLQCARMCLFSLPPMAKNPSAPHTQLLNRAGAQWSRAEQWLPPWSGGVVYLFEAWASPTCFPSDPPTVTDGATMPRWSPHYSVTPLCQVHLLMAAVLSFITAIAWQM